MPLIDASERSHSSGMSEGVGVGGSVAPVGGPPSPPFMNPWEKDTFEHVKKLVQKAIDHRSKTKFNDIVDRNEKRFMAMRSVRGLDWGDIPKNKPWPGASDIGIPIDAITIQSIVARADRVEWERFPLTNVTGVGQQDLITAPKISAFLDWQKTNKMKLRIPKMMATRRACIDGSYFWKTVWEEDWTYEDQEIFALRDPDSKTLLRDENDELVEWNPDEPPLLNDNLRPYQVVPGITTPKKQFFYRGPKTFGRSVKQILWDPDETDPEINNWEWVADTYYRSIEWLEEHGEEIGFRNIVLLRKQLEDKQKAMNETQTAQRGVTTKKILIVEWYGRRKKNGKLRNIVLAYAPDQNVFLGWQFDTLKQKTGLRRFIHRQVIPMDGKVIGMSIVTFIKGLRDTIDVIFNQMMDRGARNNNPPIVYKKGSGFNPNVHNFGYRFWPEKETNSLRVMELPKGEQIEFAKLELLFSLVQRLFGVTDTTAGIENPANRTATGITTLLAEGNINIDMIISALNESNKMLDKLIIKLNAIHMEEDELEFPIIDSYSAVMEDPDNPFATITRDELMGDYNYMPAGASLTQNTRSIREEAGFLYQTVMSSIQANPFFADLNVIREASNDLIKSFGKKNYRLKTTEDVQKEQKAQADLILATQGGEGGAGA